MWKEPENIDADEIAEQLSTRWGIDAVEMRHADVGQGSANWIIREADGTSWFVKLDPREAADFFEPGYLQPELRALLAEDLGRCWNDGPYGECARALVESCVSGIGRLFALHDRYLERLLASDVPWVVTHGEPHDGNTMVDTAGRFHLIDCNAMLVAPAERDLRLLLYGAHQGPLGLDNTAVLDAYRRGLRAGGAEPGRLVTDARDDVLELYRAEWHLMEIFRYARLFRDAHEKNQETARCWHWLNQYLPVGQNWPVGG